MQGYCWRLLEDADGTEARLKGRSSEVESSKASNGRGGKVPVPATWYHHSREEGA